MALVLFVCVVFMYISMEKKTFFIWANAVDAFDLTQSVTLIIPMINIRIHRRIRRHILWFFFLGLIIEYYGPLMKILH